MEISTTKVFVYTKICLFSKKIMHIVNATQYYLNKMLILKNYF